MTRTVLAAVGLLLAVPAAAAPVPRDLRPTAEKLLGVWKLVKSDAGLPDGTEATVEFGKDGTLTLKVSEGDAVHVQSGTYKVDGLKIHYTLKTGTTERSETLDIRTLSVDDLVTVDEESKREEFKRAKPKK